MTNPLERERERDTCGLRMMSCKCKCCSIAQDLPRFVLPAYVPVFLELMALPPFLDKARGRTMWKGCTEIPETIKGSSEDKLRTFINHKHIVIKTRQQSQQHNGHNNTTTIAIQFVVAQSVHTYCIFHLMYTVVMAQETLLRRCTYCWPLVVAYLFLHTSHNNASINTIIRALQLSQRLKSSSSSSSSRSSSLRFMLSHLWE